MVALLVVRPGRELPWVTFMVKLMVRLLRSFVKTSAHVAVMVPVGLPVDKQ
jgi:hypothetical protein